FLRFISVFFLLLLLINPKFEQVSYSIDKPSLVVLADNSESIEYLDQDENAKTIISEILENEQLKDRFELDSYVFGNGLETMDSLSFTEKQTNLSSIVKDLAQIYKNTTAPILLVSDGNQTYGNDYEFLLSEFEQPIFPVILGDTITYTDFRIQQLNVNRYAYLKNRFPVEVILTYNGADKVNTRFVVKSGNSIVYSSPISFSKDNNSKFLNFDLPASRVGVRSYSAQILPLEQEKNKVNNTKSFAVEVIDQKTNVAVISDLVHPDLGALKKSIESNEQRKVSFFKSNVDVGILNEYQLVIIYQPNRNFKIIYETLDRLNKNHFTITGTQTDWNFLGNASSILDKDQTNQEEEYQPSLNAGYNTFMVDDLKFTSFPPLKSSFGDIDFEIPVETILFKKVGNIVTEQALLATLENGERREAFLFGEGIWKWRSQSFLNSRSFNEFDNFIGKIIQYLASNKRRNRLSINYASFYDGSEPIEITAQFFDKNYEFDRRGNLEISIRDKNSRESRTLPFILSNTDYRVDLSNLLPGEYSFTVSASNEGLEQSGSFTILEFNVEQQFLNADVDRLQRVATRTGGRSFFIANTDSLIPLLINDKRFLAIQKSTKKVVPLIDWKYLLALIAVSLAVEWFLRKYNGLI
ncbi:MAG: VWA domain-containing protein, partial [Flavobacteriaceae bacterium]